MKGRNIHIDKLQIRLPKGSRLSALGIAEGLGNEILSRISDVSARQAKSHRIENLELGQIKNTGNDSPSELQSQIAKKVVSAIDENIKNRSEK